jgi:hypothetical protein
LQTVAPTASLNEFTAHSKARDDPLIETKYPTGASAQKVDPAFVWYVPGGHTAQKPPEKYFPGGHIITVLRLATDLI